MITLIAHPKNAPCCVEIQNEDGRSVLIQTDYDFPGVAATFGWSTDHKRQKSTLEYNPEDSPCDGSSFTDGTIDCPACKKKAISFINEAREWIDENDGAKEFDPGYFQTN